jgi:hypothetical protein
MDFISITQYFNKLQSALFLLLIGPLLVFIVLHFYLGETAADVRIDYVVAISVAVVADWLVAAILFNKKIKSVRNAQGLGAKLDKYFGITIVRFAFLSSASLLMALGFYLSGSDVFTTIYLLGLIISALVWPTSPRVCRHLRLRGDEREMVYFKKDTF